MKILLIAMPNSIHTARWIEQISTQGWDIHLFTSMQVDVVHEKIRNTSVYYTLYRQPVYADPSNHLHGMWLHNPMLAKISHSAFSLLTMGYQFYKFRKHKSDTSARAHYLAEVIQSVKPDLIHAIEFQHAGYLLLDAMKFIDGKLPKIMITNYGSDVYLFSRLKDHREKIKTLLDLADYYACECERDVKLARDLGFSGKVIPVMPNAGGFATENFERSNTTPQTSDRRLILLKGYQSFAGRALSGLQAIRKSEKLIKEGNYRVGVYSATPDVKIAAEIIAQDTGLDITVYDHLPHNELLDIFGQARVYIGLSISDAISTSLLEAMLMKVFPIQSGTSCADEWITANESAIIIDEPEDVQEIVNALQVALTDDNLVNQATQKNHKVARERLQAETIRQLAITAYNDIFDNL